MMKSDMRDFTHSLFVEDVLYLKCYKNVSGVKG